MKEIISLQLLKILILNKASTLKPFSEKWEEKKEINEKLIAVSTSWASIA